MSAIRQGYDQIREALGMLHHAWQQTGEGWNDIAKPKFERKYIDDFDAVVEPALRTIEHLDHTVDQAYSAVPER